MEIRNGPPKAGHVVSLPPQMPYAIASRRSLVGHALFLTTETRSNLDE